MLLSGNCDKWGGLIFPDIFKTLNLFKQIEEISAENETNSLPFLITEIVKICNVWYVGYVNNFANNSLLGNLLKCFYFGFLV